MAGADQVVCPFFGVVFERLNSLINKDRKEHGPWAGLVKELKKLYKTFLKIKEVLDDAEEKQLKEEAVRFWLEELNDAAYKANDVFDDLEYEGLQSLASQESSSGSNNVIDQFYCKIQKLIEIFHELAEDCLGLNSPHRRIDSLLTVYGRNEDVEKLVKQLLGSAYLTLAEFHTQRNKHPKPMEEAVFNNVSSSSSSSSSQENISVISILGMGGLGKTTLAQLVYNDKRVENHFEVRSWVCVSDDFDIKRIVKAFIASVSRSECDLEDLDLLQQRLQEEVNGKKFLLALDDVWEERQEEWNKLMEFLRGGARGSSIIVTTRLKTVAYVTSTFRPHFLNGLSEKDCWALFKQYAFGPGNEDRQALVKIGKQIVKKCKGLPLAARAIGGLLRFKNKESEWNEVKDSAIWELPQSSVEHILLPLRLNYNHLPSTWNQFFVYCSIFTKRYKIRKRRIDSIIDGKLFFGDPSKNRVGGRWERDVQCFIINVLLSAHRNGPRWTHNNMYLVEDAEKEKSVADIQPNKQDLASIKGKLDSRSPSSSSAGWCICRVPTKFREINEYAYTPEIISIGPFHSDKKDLKGMEVHKLRYMNSLLSRFGDRATKLEECVEAISRLEDEARKCYSEPIELNKEEFVEMMIVDGLFVIELFRKNAGEEQIDKNDPLFKNVWGMASLVRDLILLENQLPMLVLERLFNITMASQQAGKRLSELAIRFFNPLMQREESVLAKYFETGGDHLLDILSKTFYDFPSQQLPFGVKSVQVPVPTVLMEREEIVAKRAPSQGEISTSSTVKSEPQLEFKDVPSLTKLRDSGVKFMKGNNTHSFLDINFSNGVIEIPPILIRDQNFSFIRNVIAYEQGLVGHPAQMTSYVVLMNNLIQSSNDVAFLCGHGIIRNYLSDDELVSSQFQKLRNEIHLANFHHSKLCIDVNAFRVTYIQKATSVMKNVYRRMVPIRWVLLAAGSLLTFDAFKLTLATTELTLDPYFFSWQRLDFLSRLLLGIILIVMFWSDSFEGVVRL